MTDMDPDFARKLQAQVDLINVLTDTLADGGEIGSLIDEIDEKQVRGLVVALIMSRAGDREKLRELLDQLDERERDRQANVNALKDQVRAQARTDTKRALETPDLEAAYLRIAELEEIVKNHEELITTLRWLTGH